MSYYNAYKNTNGGCVDGTQLSRISLRVYRLYKQLIRFFSF